MALWNGRGVGLASRGEDERAGDAQRGGQATRGRVGDRGRCLPSDQVVVDRCRVGQRVREVVQDVQRRDGQEM